MFEGITDLGRQYLAKCQANGSGIKLAKVKIGDGRIERNEDPSLFIDIKSIKKEIEISEKYQEGNNLRLIIEFNNDGVEKGYFPREIGIYAQDGEKEILYWYINDGEQVSWLPPSSKAPIKFKYGINITATNNESTIINWTGKELWVDREFLNKELVKKQNETENRLLTRTKKIWEAINELFNNKLEKGGYAGNAKNLNDEISKKATSTQLGRVIVGNGLTTDSRGMLSVIENTTRRFVTDEEKRNWNGKLSQGYIPTSLNSAEKIFKALQGNVGIKFDTNLLYLNDVGTKKAGYCYLDKLKDGIFECMSSTTTTVNNSSYFKNLSNKNNSDRLDNLSGLKTIRAYIPAKSEITLERGFYIFTHYHTGVLNQNFVTFVSLYDYNLENRWIKMTSLIPEHNATEYHINFEYNPYLLKIRNTTEHNRNVELLKFV